MSRVRVTPHASPGEAEGGEALWFAGEGDASQESEKVKG